MENNENFKSKKIPLKDLFLWDENARFPDKYFNQPEQELIEYFLTKRDFKFRELAEAIVKDIDLPQLEKLVVYEYDNRLIVLEGNRRLAVYKLLLNPKLAKSESLITYFETLKSQTSITEESELECLITENKEIGLRYIDRKHANGNNEVGWGDAERAHYNQRRGKARKDEWFKIGLTKLIKELDLPEQIREQVLGHGYVTTFYRIINSSPAWSVFGLKLNEKNELEYDDPSFLDKLRVVIMNVLSQQDFAGNRINSRSLNKNNEIETYLKSIKKEDINKVEAQVKKSTINNLFGQATVAVPKVGVKKSNPKSTSRSYLIPKTCNLIIPPGKINNIFRELRDDLLLDDTAKSVPNAVGVLFRVFLEISVDYFLDSEGHTVSQSDTISSKIPKMITVLKSKGVASDKELKAINKVAFSSNSSTNADLLSIENFHQYVHSYKEQPTPSSLKLKWDNLEEFFVLLWNYLNNKKSKNNKP